MDFTEGKVVDNFKATTEAELLRIEAATREEEERSQFNPVRDVVQFNLENIFNKNLSDDAIYNIRKILNKNTISINDKKYILYIVDFLDDTNSINSFLSLCIKDEWINKTGISVLLNCICMKIQDSLNNVNQDLEQLNLLKEKIKIITLVGDNILDYEDKQFFKILTNIMNSNKIGIFNIQFIREMFCNEKCRENLKKFKLLFQFVIDNNIRDYNDKNDYSVWDVLLHNDVLAFDDDAYVDVIKIALTKEKTHNEILSGLINLDTLSLEKKKTIILYLTFMFDNNNIIRHYFHSKKVDVNDINIYSILFNDSLISLNDEEYKDTLERIMSSNNPNSFVKVLSNNAISNIKKFFALDLINQGDKGINDLENRCDYKECVALAAISPVLANAPLADFLNILSIVNECCLSFEGLEKERKANSNKKIDGRIKNAYIAKGIVRLLQYPNIYGNNLNKLYELINYMKNLGDKRTLIENIIDFCVNPISLYYTDDEFFRILSLMNEVYTSDSLYNKKRLMRFCFNPNNGYLTKKQFMEQFNRIKSMGGADGVRILKNLFTNLYVSFMEDRSLLFRLAECEDLLILDKITTSYNEQCSCFINKDKMLNGISDDIINSVFGCNTSHKTRSLIRLFKEG